MGARTRRCPGCDCGGRVLGQASAVGRFRPNGPIGYIALGAPTIHPTREAAEATMEAVLFERCAIRTLPPVEGRA